MNAKTEYRTLQFFEWSFYLGALALTILTAISFAMSFFNQISTDHFKLVSTFYWATVALYAASRKMARLHPMGAGLKHRKSEFILIFWMLVGIVFSAITVLSAHAKLPLMKELVFLYIILIGILLGGKFIDKAYEAVFGRNNS